MIINGYKSAINHHSICDTETFHRAYPQGRIWLKLAKQAENRVRGTLEDLQKNMAREPRRTQQGELTQAKQLG
jgi:hypothetical protein